MKRNSRPIKTLKEIEEQEEKDWRQLKIWGTIIAFLIVVCLLFLLASTMSSCTSQSANAQTYNGELRQDTTELRQIIRAYNHLLHRVWIDKPNYCEDALMETQEFMELNDLMFSQWEDTFDFYNEEDSVEYHHNWTTGDGRWPYEE